MHHGQRAICRVSSYAEDSRGTAFSRPLRYRIQAMGMNKGPGWAILRAEGHSRRCRSSESVAAHAIGDVHRIHAGRPLGVPYEDTRRGDFMGRGSLEAACGALAPKNPLTSPHVYGILGKS